MEYEAFLRLLSLTATVSTFALFLCGLQICDRIRKIGSTDGTSVAPFAITLISCIFWLGYGDLRADPTIVFVNAVGLIVQGGYFYYYWKKTRVKSRLNRLILSMIISCVFTYWFVRLSEMPKDERENLLGFICMILNVLSISAPLMDVGQVIRTKSTESMPKGLCIGNLLVSVQWLLYGLLTDDFYMKVPNSVATVISAVQLSLFAIYPSHRVVIQQKIPDELL